LRFFLAVCVALAVAGCSRSAAPFASSDAIPQSGNNEPLARVVYATLNYQNSSGKASTTFLTGIRGNNIVGMYVASGNERGFIYSTKTGGFSDVYYPGSADTVAYGPSSGGAGTIRVVGSYNLPGQKTDRGFFYDAAQPSGQQYVALDYPDATNTIAHSTFSHFVVGNWNRLSVANNDFENYPSSGHGFVYDLTSKAFTEFVAPGAKSTTCYGIFGNAIAGGYTKPKGIHVTHGYIYDTSARAWHTYDHPGAVITHFDGITGAGKGSGNYDLTGDWLGLNGQPHAFFLAVANWMPKRWIDIAYPNASTTSGNSVFTEGALTQVIGVYIAGSAVNGYVAYLR
jgi:subtilase-type serine protease